MTDQIDDRIDVLFADLRAAEIAGLRPPGTEPLRRAARRRRATLPAAAGLAVVVLTGLTVAVRPDAAPAPVPPAAPTSAPVTPGGRLLTDRVAQALDVDPVNPLPGAILTDPGAGPREFRRVLLGGSYRMKLFCAGTGSMDVTVAVDKVAQTPSATAVTVPCSTGQQTVLDVPVVVTGPTGKLTVRVVPDVPGAGRAASGFALEMAEADRKRWTGRAWEALGKPRNTLLSESYFLDFGTGLEDPPRDSGRRIQAVCVGTGTATLSAGPGDEPGAGTKKATVRCSTSDPEVVTMTYDAAGPMHTYLVPDSESVGRAAGALSVVAG